MRRGAVIGLVLLALALGFAVSVVATLALSGTAVDRPQAAIGTSAAPGLPSSPLPVPAGSAVGGATGGTDLGGPTISPPIGGSPAPSAAGPSGSPAAQLPTPTRPYRGPVTNIVPVLMYHLVSDPPPGAPYPGLYVRPSMFNAQMRALHDGGWRTITAGELGAAMAARRSVPARTIVIMFDDGYVDNYTVAFPILQSYGFRATFSVVARGGPSMMTAQQLAIMVQAGMEIGNHTMDHKNVANLSGSPLAVQITGGALRIETRLASQGVTVHPTTFVYPSGHVGQAALALLAQLHYTDAFTEVPGFAVIGRTSPLLIPRVRVSRFETLQEFLARLPVEPRP